MMVGAAQVKKNPTIVFAIILIELGFEKAMEKRMKRIQVKDDSLFHMLPCQDINARHGSKAG